MKLLRKGLAIALAVILVITVVPAVSNNSEAKAAATFAITYPTANQLVAAGYIDIKWEAATGGTVKNYDVLINGTRVTTTTSTSYEYYTTKVQAFDVNVKANYSNGTSETSDTITFGVSKKGLGLAADMGRNLNLRNMGVAWYYNWGESPSSGEQYVGIEYVPMVWQETNANNFKNRVERAKSRGYKYILTFNEPDLAGQCDMPVNDVYNVWKGIAGMQDIKVSSPVTALWPKASPNWFQTFMTKVDDNGDYKPDFISVHCYPDNYAGSGMAEWFLKEIIDWTWETYKLPIWVTEFSTTGSSVTATGGNGTKEFWEAVMPGLDAREYVERYAAFGFNNENTGLWLYNTGALTPGGVVYSQLGNPPNFQAAIPPEPDFKVTTERRTELLSNTKTINKITCEDYLNASGVTATSNSEIGNNGLASLAIDDKANSRWESKHGDDNVYLTVDLGSTKNIKEIDIWWEAASASKYNIEVSTDGVNWTIAAEGVTGNGGRCDNVTLKEQVSARYVKIQGISRSTDYGYSIYDMAIYGSDDEKIDETTTTEAPTLPPTTTPVPITTTANWFAGLEYEPYKGTGDYILNLGNWAIWLGKTHKINVYVDPNNPDHIMTQVVDNGGSIGRWSITYDIGKRGLTPGETYTVYVDIKASSTKFKPTVDGVYVYNQDNTENAVTIEIPSCVANEDGYIYAAFGLGDVGETVFIDISNVVVKDSQGNIVEALDIYDPNEVPTTPAPTTPSEVEPTSDAPTAVSPTTKVQRPGRATIKKVYTKKNAAKKLKLSVKKVKGAEGYAIQLSTTKKFKKVLVKRTYKKRVVTIRAKRLKNKKKLYVRVKAYKLVNGKKLYSAKWSKVKKVKIKK